MSLYQKLLRVQTQLKAPKNQYNIFGKYYYRSCEDITEAVKPLLAEENLVMTISDELTLIGDRYYIKATVTVIDGETGEKHEVHAYAREAESKKGMDESQITGAASSYARKYALNGMFAIDDTKDSDATNTHEKNENNNQNIDKQTIAAITSFIKRDEKAKNIAVSFLKTKGFSNFDGLYKLSQAEADELLDKIKEVV
jgi:hypothetical protein